MGKVKKMGKVKNMKVKNMKLGRLLVCILTLCLIFTPDAYGVEKASGRPGAEGIIMNKASAAAEGPRTESYNRRKEKGGTGMQLAIGKRAVAVEWEKNASVDALAGLCAKGPLTVQMSMYGGFEQVGSLGASLPRNDARTTTAAGDIVLYSGNQIVIFYGSNSWAYTRLGKVTGLSRKELADILGNGDVTITIY